MILSLCVVVGIIVDMVFGGMCWGVWLVGLVQYGLVGICRF